MKEETQTSDANTEINWLVMISVRGHNYPTFVRAVDTSSAHAKAVAKWDFLKLAPAYSIEAYVVDPDSLQDVMPDMKQLARFYWHAALENAGLARGAETDEEYFEATWEDHGVQLDDGK